MRLNILSLINLNLIFSVLVLSYNINLETSLIIPRLFTDQAWLRLGIIIKIVQNPYFYDFDFLIV